MPDSLIPPLRTGPVSDEPMENYLFDPGVGGHALWQLHSKCPAYAWARSFSNPKREPDEGSKARAYGTALHMLVLEGADKFHRHYVAKPEGMAFNRKDGIEWRERERERDGGPRIILDTGDAAEIINIAQAILNHPDARKVLAKTEREVSLYATDEATGLRIKSRPDALGIHMAVNVKTTADAEPRAWKRQAIKLGYHVSQATTARVMSALGMDPLPYLFLVVEKARNPIVQLYELDDGLALLGEQIVDRSLRQWAKCAESGVWPGYRSGIWRIAADKWDLDDIERMQREGDEE